MDNNEIPPITGGGLPGSAGDNDSLGQAVIAVARAFNEAIKGGLYDKAREANMNYQRQLASNRVLNRFMQLEEYFRAASSDPRLKVSYDFCQTIHIMTHADTKFNCMQAVVHKYDENPEEAVNWMNKTVADHAARTLNLLEQHVTRQLPQQRLPAPKPRVRKKPGDTGRAQH
jgi:hypothetical protein